MKFNMKKAVSWLLALAMIFTMLPSVTLTALAAEDTYDLWVGGVGLNNGEYLANGATEASNTKPQSDGYAHYALVEGTPTLTLNGYTYTGEGHEYAAIYYGGTNELNLVLEGTNTVTHQPSDGAYDSYGVRAIGSIKVSGSGSLTAIGGAANSSYGVYARDTITVSGGTLTGTGGTAGDYSFGVRAGSIEVSGSGSLTGTGGTATAANSSADSYGVYADSSITVSGDGSLTATGGEAAKLSCGVNAVKDITLSGGSLKGNGGAAPDSCGVLAVAEITVSGGKLEGEGGTATAESESSVTYSYGVKASSITVSDNGSLTGTGGKASYSYGVWAKSSIAVSGGELIGKGGEATTTAAYISAESYGVYADSSITLSGSGTLTGKGGDSSEYSYGVTATNLAVKEKGTLTGTGGKASYSYGVWAKSSIAVSGGELIGKGGDAGVYSYGVWVDGTIAVSGGKLEGEGGTATSIIYNVSSYGVYADYIALSNGTLKGTGGKATSEDGLASSYGVYAWVSIAISGNVDLTGTGGTATTKNPENGSSESCGLAGVYNGFVYGYMEPEKYCTFYYGQSEDTAKPEATLPQAPSYENEEWESDWEKCQYVHIESKNTNDVTHSYNLWVGGQQFTSANLIITGNNGGTATYEPTTNTLTLDGFSCEGEGYTWDNGDSYAAIYYGGTDELKLVTQSGGICEIWQKSDENNLPAYSYGLYSNGSISVSGYNSINAYGGEASAKSYGVYANGSITVSGYQSGLGGNAASYGVYAKDDITVSGVLTVLTGTATSYGVYANDTITVSRGSLKGEGDYGVYTANGITFNGGVAEVNGTVAAFNAAPTIDKNWEGDYVFFYGNGEADAEGPIEFSEIAIGYHSKNYVRIAMPVATVTTASGTTNYYSISDAIAAVASATEADKAVVKLQSDVTTDAVVEVTSGTFTIDLNGKIWTSTGFAMYIKEYTNVTTHVTITDSSEDQTGKFSGSGDGYSLITLYGSAKLTIAGGTLESQNNVVNMDDTNPIGGESTELTITGGTLTTTATCAIEANGSLVKITGGTIKNLGEGLYYNICYDSGTIDLSGYENPTGITIGYSLDEGFNPDIKLPDNFALLTNEYNENYEVPTTLSGNDIYTVGIPLWVGGQPFISSDLTIEDGTGGTAAYTPAQGSVDEEGYTPATLTLENFNYSGVGYLDNSDLVNAAAIYYAGENPLNLVLKGSSSVTQTGGRYAKSYGLFVRNDLSVSGNGSLTATSDTAVAAGAEVFGSGVYVSGELTVSGGILTGVGGTNNNQTGVSATAINLNGGVTVAQGGKAFNTNPTIANTLKTYDIKDNLIEVDDYTALTYVRVGGSVSVTMNGETTYYTDLSEAIAAVKSATADDNAVVKVLDDLTITRDISVNGGVFTLDTNGKKLTFDPDSSTGALLSVKAGGNVTITGGGTLYHRYELGSVVLVNGGTLTVEEVTISGFVDANGNQANGITVWDGGKATINNGTISIISVLNSTLNINGGKVTGSVTYASSEDQIADGKINGGEINGGVIIRGDIIMANGSNVEIADGTISGGITVDGSNNTITLTGGTFKDDITLTGSNNLTLSGILGECMAYWQNGTKVTLTENQTAITSGDVTVSSAHDWSVTYDFAADGSTCTATHICDNDANHNETETVNATGEVKIPATCTEKGWTTYTANFEAAWAEDQTLEVEDIPALNHKWTVTYDFAADGSTCTATHICGNNASHNETETVNATGEVKIPATCTEKGWTTYTANFEAAWAEDGQTKDVQDISATGHDMQETSAKVDATCMAAGSFTWKCANCDATREEALNIDPSNHTGNNTLGVDAKEATCSTEGYTGDTYCECGQKIASGEVILATGEHEAVSGWLSDDDTHWQECHCGFVINKGEHDNGDDEICDTCGRDSHEHDYGSDWQFNDGHHWKQCSCSAVVEEAAHTTATREENRVEPGCHTSGSYETVTYCSVCQKELLSGEMTTIPATGHNMQETTAAVAATCTAPGKTAVLTCANNCGKTEGGTEIPATGEHSFSDKWSYDETNHWHTTTCGHDVTKDQEAHHGGTATTEAKAICEVCGQPYGNLAVNTETTTNEDGSVTTTTKDEQGTVTEITEKVDGSVTTVVTQTDGTVTTTDISTTTETDKNGSAVTVEQKVEKVASSDGKTTASSTTTTVKSSDSTVVVKEQTVVDDKGNETTTSTTQVEMADGSTSTTTVDAQGTVKVDVALSEAAASGANVTLPIQEVSKTNDTKTATAITVTTGSKTPVTVTIPVKEASASTVAVLVNEDGSETVISTTVMADDGVVITIPEDATIKIVDNSQKFGDVSENSWYSDAVDFASARNLTNGVGNDLFNPDGKVTRAQFVTMLYRLAGEPVGYKAAGFQDVKDGQWYTDAINWAAAEGITNGYGNGNFGVNDEITREQMAVMMYRYAEGENTDHDLSHFNDAHTISDYAVEALAWANANGIINGMGNGTLDPQGDAKRAQAAQILMNYIQNGM